MPNWKPGTKDGKAVSSEMYLPIVFKLDSKPPQPPKPPKAPAADDKKLRKAPAAPKELKREAPPAKKHQ